MNDTQRKAMFARKKWKLYTAIEDENKSKFVESFSSKNDAVGYVKDLDVLFDRESSKFNYNQHFKLWSDSPINEGYVITKTKPPDAID